MTGEELRRRREALGLNQTELAVLVPVDHNTIWRWEHDHRAIPAMLDTVLRYLEAQADLDYERVRHEQDAPFREAASAADTTPDADVPVF